MMKYYCTHFDINYISHALSLYSSLEKFASPFTLYMFCMDDLSYQHVSSKQLENVKPVSYSLLEEKIPSLLCAKQNRTRVEYFYTCSPATCYFVLEQLPENSHVTYLDADLYFFGSPEPLFNELKDASVGIIEHKFHLLSKRNRKYGIFNVGWVTFKKDSHGRQCLNDWLNDCIAWCYQRLEDGKYADQKYLDSWPAKYLGVKVLKNKGANLAIWNIRNYKLKQIHGKIYVDDEPLIFYHFANLKQLTETKYTSDLSRVLVPTSNIILYDIYLPYIRTLRKYAVKKIIAKKQNYSSALSYVLSVFSRKARRIFYPDIIDITIHP